MKRLLILSVLLCGALLAAAQPTKEDYLRRYGNLEGKPVHHQI